MTYHFLVLNRNALLIYCANNEVQLEPIRKKKESIDTMFKEKFISLDKLKILFVVHSDVSKVDSISFQAYLNVIFP